MNIVNHHFIPIAFQINFLEYFNPDSRDNFMNLNS